MNPKKKTESDILFNLVDRIGELQRVIASQQSRLDRHDELFAKIGDLAKIDLRLAERAEMAESR